MLRWCRCRSVWLGEGGLERRRHSGWDWARRTFATERHIIYSARMASYRKEVLEVEDSLSISRGVKYQGCQAAEKIPYLYGGHAVRKLFLGVTALSTTTTTSAEMDCHRLQIHRLVLRMFPLTELDPFTQHKQPFGTKERAFTSRPQANPSSNPRYSSSPTSALPRYIPRSQIGSQAQPSLARK